MMLVDCRHQVTIRHRYRALLACIEALNGPADIREVLGSAAQNYLRFLSETES